MYCPSCRGEYREGFTWCRDCDVELVETLPEETAEEDAQSWEEPSEDAWDEEEETAVAAEPDRAKSLRAVELLLVLFIAFAAPLFRSIYDWVNHLRPENQSLSLYQELTGIVSAATALVLLRYVLFRQGRNLRQLGLTAEKADILPTLLLTVLSFVPNVIIRALSGHVAFTGPVAKPLVAISGIPSLGLMTVIYYLVRAAWEELIVRAYMITEVVELTGQVTLAVLSSVCLQALYHLYQGWYYALMDTGGFLIVSIYYVRYRRITPVVLSHWLYNLLIHGYSAVGR